MKRRVRTHPTNPYYTNEPAVSVKNIADKPPVPNATVADRPPHTVDKHPARMSGVAGFVSRSKPVGKKANLTPAKVPTANKVPTQGKLRMSGVKGAHRIGGIRKLRSFT